MYTEIDYRLEQFAIGHRRTKAHLRKVWKAMHEARAELSKCWALDRDKTNSYFSQCPILTTEDIKKYRIIANLGISDFLDDVHNYKDHEKCVEQLLFDAITLGLVNVEPEFHLS